MAQVKNKKTERYSKLWVFISVIVFMACNNTDPTSPKDTKLQPTVRTSDVKYITQYAAMCGGVVTSAEGSDGIVYGVCWSINPHPTIADSTSDSYFKALVDFTTPVDFTSPIKGLTGSTAYYVRAYAENVNKITNSDGYYPIGEIVYGNEYKFTTDIATPTVTDADGNVYHTIQIGTQLWMLENLKTTKYNDGTDIPTVKGTYINEFFDLLSPGYCDYFNNKPNKNLKNTFGVLYNGYAVATGKLAPIGWHVPSIDDCLKLSDYLGGDSVSGGKLKSASISSLANHMDFMYLGNWMPPNTGATNSSGFSALPGGYFYEVTDESDLSMGFKTMGYFGFWWCSTQFIALVLRYDNTSTFFFQEDKRLGFSVRCVRN